MDFPHLGDTEFPILKTENVYAFKNTFDYHRWDENTVVRLVNVLWDSALNDAPLFDSNDVRDAWFDSLEDGFALRLETAARIVPEGYVKIPVPYDVAARYNYLYVEVPVATGDEMIDYEQPYGIRRWYFFIDHIDYGSPNATHVYVTNDFWTTFQNDVTIRYMMLERGHAPVAASDVNKYLANPIENSELLLAPDVDFGRGSVVRHSKMVPFGNGTKYVVFASMATSQNVREMGRRTGDGTDVWTPPTYSDTQHRDGHQMTINGYVWGVGYDYSSLRTYVNNGASNKDRIPNNITCWAVRADRCFGFGGSNYDESFLVRMPRECPAFLQTIRAMFVVDSSMIEMPYSPISMCGSSLYYCRGVSQTVQKFALNDAMFSFPDRYKRYAKLYTFPYSLIELTDNDGQTVSIRIEDTGEITYQLITSVAFPFLDMRVLFRGVGGNGAGNVYSWTSLTDDTSQIEIGADDWGSIKFDWPIPTYGLYMDGETAYNLRNWANLKNARIDAITAYHATMRDANCAENNAIALAQTAETNADNTASTHESNEYDSANTLVANTANTCNAQTANTALTVATNNANVALGNSTSTAITTMSNGVAGERVAKDNLVSAYTVAQQNESTVATTANSGTATILSGAVNGMASATGDAVTAVGAQATGTAVVQMAIGGLMGAVSGYVNASTAKENAAIVTQAQSSVMSATTSANSYKVAISNDENTMTTQLMNTLHTDQTTNTNNCITGQTANNVAAATNNAANTSATMKGNATRSKNTAVGNAARTRGTSVTNAGYTQGDTESTAKELLRAAQNKAKNSYETACNQMPVQIGETSGAPMSDYFRTRGVQIKVRTESESAIAQAGDHFARYGYALNRMWDVKESGFCPMRNFCYWKASDIWVDDRLSSTSDASKAIQRMFLEGVTLWKNPNEIGRVSVYDN